MSRDESALPTPAGSTTAIDDLPSQWGDIDRVFKMAVPLASSDQAAFLNRVCGKDTNLRRAVEQLLEGDRRACQEGFLEGGAPTDAGGRTAQERDRFLGTRLGPYVVVERIASGAMGIVYRAERTSGFQQQVAVKVLRPWLCDDESVARFRAEQQALADLPHPNIARLLDAGVTADGAHYLILEFIDGHRLDEAVAAIQPSLQVRLDWFATICRTVAFAHDRGIAHRDLKPANILMIRNTAVAAESWTPTITDFGLAKITNEHGATLTATGAIMGTPGYMAPEQVQGTAMGDGVATDVYGLGAVLYFLLTGKPPFRGGSITETLRELEHREPESPAALAPGIPADLNTVCLKCLEKQPRDRYASANEVADEIQRFVAGYSVRARPVGMFGRVIRWGNRNRTTAALVGSLGVTLIAGLVATSILYVAAENGRREAEQERGAALDTIDRLLTEVSKSLQNQPGTSEVRQSLLAAAKDAYDARISIRRSEDKRLQVEAATAAYRLAQIYAQTQRSDDRYRVGKEALAQFRQLAQQYPDEHTFQFDVFHCLFLLRDYPGAVDCILRLSERHRLPHYRQAAAGALCSWAMEMHGADRQRSEALLHESLRIADALVAEFPEEVTYRRSIGNSTHGLGCLRMIEADYAEALRYFQRALCIQEQLFNCQPRELAFREELAGTLRQVGPALIWLGCDKSAQDYITKAATITRQGIECHPQNIVAWRMHISSLWSLMDLCLPASSPGTDASSEQLAAVVGELATTLQSARRFWPATEPSFDLLYAAFLADCPLKELRQLGEAEKMTSGLSVQGLSSNDAYFLAVVRLRSGKPDEALQLFGHWGPSGPARSVSELYPALALAHLGDFATADSILDNLQPYRNTQLYRRVCREIAELK